MMRKHSREFFMVLHHPVVYSRHIWLLNQAPNVSAGAAHLYRFVNAVIEHYEVIAVGHLVDGETDPLPNTLFARRLAGKTRGVIVCGYAYQRHPIIHASLLARLAPLYARWPAI